MEKLEASNTPEEQKTSSGATFVTGCADIVEKCTGDFTYTFPKDRFPEGTPLTYSEKVLISNI